MTGLGLLDQWLAEKKFTEEEALSISYDMLSAGIDTVSINIFTYICIGLSHSKFLTRVYRLQIHLLIFSMN